MAVSRRTRIRQRRALLAGLAIANALLAFGILLGDHGLRQYLRLRATLQQRSGEAYERIVRNRSLLDRLNGLRSDRRVVDEVARSSLGVAGTDEIIYVFRPADDRAP